jgi:hypothetical protein
MDLFASTSVNETIKPLTDFEHWGVIERWSYPDDATVTRGLRPAPGGLADPVC